MASLAFDPTRLDALRAAMRSALDELDRMRGSDVATDEAMRTIRSARQLLAEQWLPRVIDVLQSKSMTSPTRTKLNDFDFAGPGPKHGGADPFWQITRDPGTPAAAGDPAKMYGPELPGSRSFGEVVEAIQSGELVPMTAPVDAQGRAGAHYTSLAFAPGEQRDVGHADLTPNFLKFADFMSDGLPIGWREQKELRIIYFRDARVTSSVHVLDAYDRDSGPTTVDDQTTEATVSGYLVVRQDSTVAEVSVQIGPGIQDPTQSFPIISDRSTEYAGVFYPDNPPDFQPIPHEPRFVRPTSWTFTTSAAPMADGWGTWGI